MIWKSIKLIFMVILIASQLRKVTAWLLFVLALAHLQL